MGTIDALVLGGPGPRCLVFLPGFMSRPSSYTSLLEPVARAGTWVHALGVVRPGLGALLGRVTPAQEAEVVAQECRRLIDGGAAVWLAGHSRGGQVAWRAAELVPAAGLVVVDPVDGSGPRSGPEVTLRAPTFTFRPLVIGAAIGGSCAPNALNHERFAAAAPGCAHVVVDDCGHADLLDEPARRRGRRLCGGGSDPDRARARISALMADWIAGGGTLS